MHRLLRGVSICSLALGACRPTPDSRPESPRTVAEDSTRSRTLPDTGDADAFVRAFYESFAPRGQASGLAATDSLLGERPALFAPALLTALRQDSAARAAAAGEIDGLDFEPFLNSQDPCARYTVGPAIWVDSAGQRMVRVAVRADCDRASGPQPAFAVGVIPHAGSWQFVNVQYGPSVGDLLTLLHTLHPSTASTPADSVRRLAPAAFSELPADVQRSLQARDCLIPQSWIRQAPHNVVPGAFTAPEAHEWAVLCSVAGVSQILIYRAGSGDTAQVVDSLRRSPDEDWVQGIGNGRWGYSRLLELVPRTYVRRWRTDIDGNPIPQPIDHDALSQVFVEKYSEAFYFAGGRWYRQLTGD